MIRALVPMGRGRPRRVGRSPRHTGAEMARGGGRRRDLLRRCSDATFKRAF